jgi:ribosomal protein S18 acetylase RimI-like enzyme
VIVRPVEPADVPALSALAARTWADAFGHTVSVEEQVAELEQTRSEQYFRAALEKDAILVAEDAGELVGYVQFGDVGIAEADAGPGDQEIRRVYVETRLHGRGIGRALTEAALEHPRLAAAPRVFLQVWDENNAAVGLYESLGFHVVGRTRFTIGDGEVVEDLVMALVDPRFGGRQGP